MRAKHIWRLFVVPGMAMMLLTAPLARADAMVVGTVEYVRLHDPAIVGTPWAPPVFWFTLAGIVNIPSCVSFGNKAIFAAGSKEMFATVMAAQLTGKQIAVYYSNTTLLNGFCRAGYITTGDPPPNF